MGLIVNTRVDKQLHAIVWARVSERASGMRRCERSYEMCVEGRGKVVCQLHV